MGKITSQSRVCDLMLLLVKATLLPDLQSYWSGGVNVPLWPWYQECRVAWSGWWFTKTAMTGSKRSRKTRVDQRTVGPTPAAGLLSARCCQVSARWDMAQMRCGDIILWAQIVEVGCNVCWECGRGGRDLRYVNHEKWAAKWEMSHCRCKNCWDSWYVSRPWSNLKLTNSCVTHSIN